MAKSTTAFATPSFYKKLPSLLEAYVESCRPPPDADPKKNSGKLANWAGFCRYVGCTLPDLLHLRDVNARLFDHLCVVFEDELLNHSPSPTIMSAYLKKRVGYIENAERDEREIACNQMNLIFEHNIEEDGA